MIHNTGMTPALDDRAYFNLMTNNGRPDLVSIVVKHYPELAVFA